MSISTESIFEILARESEGDIGVICNSNLNIVMSGIPLSDDVKMSLARCHQGTVQSKKHFIKPEYSPAAHKKLAKSLIKGKCAAYEQLEEFADLMVSANFEAMQELAAASLSPTLWESDSLFADIEVGETEYEPLPAEDLALSVAFAIDAELQGVSDVEERAMSTLAKGVKALHSANVRALAAQGAFDPEVQAVRSFSKEWTAHWEIVATAAKSASENLVGEKAVRLFFCELLKLAFTREENTMVFSMGFGYCVAESLEMGAFMHSMIMETIVPSDATPSLFWTLSVGRCFMVVKNTRVGTFATVVANSTAKSGLSIVDVDGKLLGNIFPEFATSFPVGSNVLTGVKGDITLY